MKKFIQKLIDKNFEKATQEGLKNIDRMFAERILYAKAAKQKIGFKI